MFKRGDKVKVIKLVDEHGNKYYLNQIGIIYKLKYKHGCGEIPNDPMIQVKFNDGQRAEYWTEELEKV